MDWLADHDAPADLDMVIDGETPSGDAAAAARLVASWADAGCTWWLESRWGPGDDLRGRLDQMRERIAAGPPAR